MFGMKDTFGEKSKRILIIYSPKFLDCFQLYLDYLQYQYIPTLQDQLNDFKNQLRLEEIKLDDKYFDLKKLQNQFDKDFLEEEHQAKKISIKYQDREGVRQNVKIEVEKHIEEDHIRRQKSQQPDTIKLDSDEKDMHDLQYDVHEKFILKIEENYSKQNYLDKSIGKLVVGLDGDLDIDSGFSVRARAELKAIFDENLHKVYQKSEDLECGMILDQSEKLKESNTKIPGYLTKLTKGKTDLENKANIMNKICEESQASLPEITKEIDYIKYRFDEYKNYNISDEDLVKKAELIHALNQSSEQSVFDKYHALMQKLNSKWFFQKIAPMSSNMRKKYLDNVTPEDLIIATDERLKKMLEKAFKDDVQGSPTLSTFIPMTIMNEKISKMGKGAEDYRATDQELFELFLVEQIFEYMKFKDLIPVAFMKQDQSDLKLEMGSFVQKWLRKKLDELGDERFIRWIGDEVQNQYKLGLIRGEGLKQCQSFITNLLNKNSREDMHKYSSWLGAGFTEEELEKLRESESKEGYKEELEFEHAFKQVIGQKVT